MKVIHTLNLSSVACCSRQYYWFVWFYYETENIAFKQLQSRKLEQFIGKKGLVP